MYRSWQSKRLSNQILSIANHVFKIKKLGNVRYIWVTRSKRSAVNVSILVIILNKYCLVLIVQLVLLRWEYYINIGSSNQNFAFKNKHVISLKIDHEFITGEIWWFCFFCLLVFWNQAVFLSKKMEVWWETSVPKVMQIDFSWFSCIIIKS